MFIHTSWAALRGVSHRAHALSSPDFTVWMLLEHNNVSHHHHRHPQQEVVLILEQFSDTVNRGVCTVCVCCLARCATYTCADFTHNWLSNAVKSCNVIERINQYNKPTMVLHSIIEYCILYYSEYPKFIRLTGMADISIRPAITAYGCNTLPSMSLELQLVFTGMLIQK